MSDTYGASLGLTNQTALNLTPTNRNFLSPIPFALLVKKLPNVDFFVQKINLPGVSSTGPVQPTMFSNIPRPGTKLKWEPLRATFKVNEDCTNWLEVFNWIKAINEAYDTDDYAALASNAYWTGLGVTSELILVIHDNERQPQLNVYFHDAYPVALSDMYFDSTKTDVDYVTCTVQFLYSTYNIDNHV